MSKMHFSKERIDNADGTWSLAYQVEIPAHQLKFEDLHPMSSYIRQQDIARMHFARAMMSGEANPHIMTWTAMQTDRRAEHLFPGLDYALDGENIISANSLVTCILRKLLSQGWLQLHEYVGDTYEWKAEVPDDDESWQARAKAMTSWLEESIELDLYPNIERGSYKPRLFHNFDARRKFVRIGRCDFVRHFVQNHERAAAFNTSHFLHEHDDLISHHSGYGDAIGLMVTENTILRPAIYRRGCLLFDGERWRIQSMSLADIVLVLPGDISLRADDAGDYQFHLNPLSEQPIAIYTRAARLAENSRPLDLTPASVSRSEYTIINRQIVSWKRDGGLQIPQNGFVLSLHDDSIPELAREKIVQDAWVEYEFADEARQIAAGIQAGPILLQNGSIVVEQAPKQEEFWASRVVDGEHVVGITPVNMSLSDPGERKARAALGIRADGDLVLVAIDGCDPAAKTEYDSAGASLLELAEYLRAKGAVDALNLSGEGSAHLFIHSGLANRPSDRRGQPGIIYERMLPSIGIVS